MEVFPGGSEKKNYADFTVSMKAYELYNEYDLKLSETTMHIYCMLQFNMSLTRSSRANTHHTCKSDAFPKTETRDPRTLVPT